jgi:type II secretory pathway component PulF
VAGTSLLPISTSGVLLHAEKQGRVPDALIRLSDHLQDRLEGRINSLESWLEPLLLCLVGGWIFFIAFGMYTLLSAVIYGLFAPLFFIPTVVG